MAFLETVVLLDVVQIITANDNGALHLGGLHNTLKNTATDGDIAGEWALPVDVVSFNGFLWCLESKTNILEVAGTRLSLLTRDNTALALEDGWLLLEGFLDL